MQQEQIKSVACLDTITNEFDLSIKSECICDGKLLAGESQVMCNVHQCSIVLVPKCCGLDISEDNDGFECLTHSLITKRPLNNARKPSDLNALSGAVKCKTYSQFVLHTHLC